MGGHHSGVHDIDSEGENKVQRKWVTNSNW